MLYDSFKILGLGPGSSKREMKLTYHELARLYHPDKWEEARHITGMTLEETTAHFQMLNNAQFHLRQVL
jgi:DnaJ-class molecular chaperone